MQHSSLRLLPGPENLGARLAMFLLAVMLIGVVLFVLIVLDLARLTPVDMAHTFAWVVLSAALVLLLLAGGLWRIISREVLRPLEQIRAVIRQEEQGGAGLGQVAATMRELKDTVHRTQAELDESNRNLRHVEKLAMVGKLAAGMAHSVRNPLTSVKMRLFSLNRTAHLNEDQNDDLRVISQEIEHIDTIVQNFLEFSRPPKLQMQMVSPSTVLDMMLQLLTHRLKSYEVTVTRNKGENLPEIKCDPEQLKEVFVNLVENACQAMGRGGHITITENVEPGENGSVCVIHVQDNGPGMSEKIAEKIFNPFFTTKDEGTGLGLSIVERIIENHNGRIRVESREGEGACFIVTLPVMPGHGAAA